MLLVIFQLYKAQQDTDKQINFEQQTNRKELFNIFLLVLMLYSTVLTQFGLAIQIRFILIKNYT